jgi:hypothetical protein
MKKEGIKMKDSRGPSQQRWNNLIILTLSLLIILIIGLSIFIQNKQLKRITRVNQEKTTLVQEFTKLKESYKAVESWNKDYKDLIAKDKKRIDQLIREVKFKTEDIEGYRLEKSKLQNKLNDYLKLVDSLEITLNQNDKESSEMISVLKDSRDSLLQKIEKASHLNCYNIDVTIENKREKATKDPGRVDKIGVRFKLGENIFISPGLKEVYLRLIRPDDSVIYSSEKDLFTSEGKELVYTEKTSVQYDNKDTWVDITWRDPGVELIEGFYYVTLFVDGYEIGSQSFRLEKRFLFF